MQSKPEINGEPELDEAVDLELLFRQSSPRFTSVNVDAVLRDVNGRSRDVVSGVGAMARQAEPQVGGGGGDGKTSVTQRRATMLKRIGVLGVCAASICLILVFGLSGNVTVWAQVQDALKSVHTASYSVANIIGDQPALTWRVKIMGEQLCRVEQPNGVYLICDVKGKKIMEVNPRESKVRITENLPIAEDHNLLAKLANLKATAAQEHPRVPNREIGGVKAAGFVVQENGIQYNVWVDPSRHLPLEVERVVTESDRPAPTVVERWSDFRFDEPLDQSQFAFEAPKGFAVETRRATGGMNRPQQSTGQPGARPETTRKTETGSYGFGPDAKPEAANR